MVSALDAVAQSPALTLALAVLNVVQTLWLAEIASRSRRRRADDPRTRRRRPPAGR